MKRFLLLLAVVVASASSARADLVIDDFSTPQPLTLSQSPYNHTQSVFGTGLIGGYREFLLQSFPAGRSSSMAEVVTQDGILQLNNPNGYKDKFGNWVPGVSSILEVRYDGSSFGATPNPNGFSATDVTQGGSNVGIAFSASNDFGDTPSILQGGTIKFTLYDQNGNSGLGSVTLAKSGFDMLNYFIPFLGNFSGVDLTKITSVVAVIDTSNDGAQDIVLSSFSFTAPAPPGVILAASALILGACYSWRVRRNAKTTCAV